jgi:hypothetical protein
MKKIIYSFFEMLDMAPEKKLYWELYFCTKFPYGKSLLLEGKIITLIENLKQEDSYKVLEFNIENKTSFTWIKVNNNADEVFNGTLSEGLKRVHLN